MLAADKELLESELKKKAIGIQNQEMTFFVTNLGTIASCASMLAGFSYSALFHTDTELRGSESNTLFVLFFYFSTVVAMGTELTVLMLATVCRLWGTGLALRGPVGSMRNSVDKMAQYQTICVRLFVAGLVSFHASAVSYIWCAFTSPIVCVLLTTLLIISVTVLLSMMRGAAISFHVEKQHLVSGSLNAGSFVKNMEQTSLFHSGNGNESFTSSYSEVAPHTPLGSWA